MRKNAQEFDPKFRSQLISRLHEKLKDETHGARTGTSFSLDLKVVDDFCEAARSLGFHVPSRRGANRLIEAMMGVVIDQAQQQSQLTLTVNYKPQITVNNMLKLTVDQRIKLNLVKSDLSKALSGFMEHTDDQFTGYWIKFLKRNLTKAVKVAEKIRDPELQKLLEQAEKAMEAQVKDAGNR